MCIRKYRPNKKKWLVIRQANKRLSQVLQEGSEKLPTLSSLKLDEHDLDSDTNFKYFMRYAIDGIAAHLNDTNNHNKEKQQNDIGVIIMARAEDFNLGEFVFPRGWFMIAEASELDDGPIGVRFFANDFALYRGTTGKVVLLDAYCAHMGTHLAESKSASIVINNEQIEGDSIRCPYHGWPL